MKTHKKHSDYAQSYFVKLCVAVLLAGISVADYGCKKMVQVTDSPDQILSSKVFDNAATANSAIAGIYRQFRDNLPSFITLYNSMSSDEVANYSANMTYDEYRTNSVLPTQATLPWSQLYAIIYSCNSAIEGLGKSSINSSARQYYLGEAKFNRALAYFYLVNLFGDVPLITTTDVSLTVSASRSKSSQVYDLIIADLKDAQTLLGSDYNFTGGERTRANKWVATAFLAKVYLYLQRWPEAEQLATGVINSGLYQLAPTPAGVFNKNNNEAILQWTNGPTDGNAFAGSFLVTSTPTLICTDNLMASFENGDLRKSSWIKSTVYSGQTIYYPYKYTTAASNPPEYFMVLRLAEVYLIRAEARIRQNDISNGMSDINLIRSRAGLAAASASSQSDALTAVLQERRVELFTEGCNRWLDLIRTGNIDSVMAAEKPSTWQATAKLYPVPLNDIQRDPALTQNPGY